LAGLPNDAALAPYRGLHFHGVCTFRSASVGDFEWKDLPQGAAVGMETCMLRFVDSDLTILTNVVTGEKREFRRIAG